MKYQKNAFSLVEVLVGIVVFLIGILSVYAIIQSTMDLNNRNKNYIIASSLAREQIEQIRFIRDTNFQKIQAYNVINPQKNDYTDENKFIFGQNYIMFNDFSDINPAKFSVQVKNVGNFDEQNLSNDSDFRLCLNKTTSLYTYCSQQDGQKTPFYKYVSISAIKDKNGQQIEGAFRVRSRVVWHDRGIHEYYIDAIFTDYKIY